jgi:hypothetical protein
MTKAYLRAQVHGPTTKASDHQLSGTQRAVCSKHKALATFSMIKVSATSGRTASDSASERSWQVIINCQALSVRYAQSTGNLQHDQSLSDFGKNGFRLSI